LDSPKIKVSDLGGLDLEACCLDVWMLKDWNGLGEVTAFWGEGIGRNSHTLKLQELSGLHLCRLPPLSLLTPLGSDGLML
jgi:hypothetical protein